MKEWCFYLQRKKNGAITTTKQKVTQENMNLNNKLIIKILKKTYNFHSKLFMFYSTSLVIP